MERRAVRLPGAVGGGRQWVAVGVWVLALVLAGCSGSSGGASPSTTAAATTPSPTGDRRQSSGFSFQGISLSRTGTDGKVLGLAIDAQGSAATTADFNQNPAANGKRLSASDLARLVQLVSSPAWAKLATAYGDASKGGTITSVTVTGDKTIEVVEGATTPSELAEVIRISLSAS